MSTPDLSNVPFEALWKEIGLRYEAAVLVTMQTNLADVGEEETKDIFYTGGHCLNLGLLEYGKDRMLRSGTICPDSET